MHWMCAVDDEICIGLMRLNPINSEIQWIETGKKMLKNKMQGRMW